MSPKLLSLLLINLAAVSSASAAAISIGVNYGALADNLPPPSQVAAFLKSRTFIDRDKLFDCNPDFIQAFAGTGISVAITAPNDAIPSLATPVGASSWIQSNILPFIPATNIILVFIGNEFVATADRNIIAHLVPAMRSVNSALSSADHPQIRVAAAADTRTPQFESMASSLHRPPTLILYCLCILGLGFGWGGNIVDAFKVPFRVKDVLPILPREVSWPVMNSIHSAVDLLPSFVGAVGPDGGSVGWKGACFFENEARLEFSDAGGGDRGLGGGVLRLKVRL